jgi:hypothetical protein
MLVSDSSSPADAGVGQVLPVMRLNELLRYHSRDALERFHAEHAELLRSSVLMMVVPLAERVAEYTVLERAKPVYALDRRQYVFLSRDDYRAMRRRSRSELADFMARHHGCLFKIVSDGGGASASSPPVKTPNERALVKRKRADDADDETAMVVVSRELHEQNAEMRVRLALAERECEYAAQEHARELERLREQHEQEKRLLRAELTVEALTKHLKSGNSAAAAQPLVRTKLQWLNGQLYQQDLSRLALQNATRWFNLFQNPDLTLDRLHAAVQIERVVGAPRHKQLRVLLPVTYRYSLRRIVQSIAVALEHTNEAYMQALLEAVPSDYRVVLYGGAHLPAVKHAINCTILALHLHLCRQARLINRKLADEGENWSVKLCDQEAGAVQHLTPSLDLMAQHYPSTVYSGQGTYLLADMTMPACYQKSRSTTKSSKSGASATGGTTGNKSRRTETQHSPTKGLGTGHGKSCPYCGQLSRTLIQGANYQKSHQPINCPYIALLSQNEAVLLETLRQRCRADQARGQGKKCNKLAEHAFLVGSNAKKCAIGGAGDLEFDLDSQTLWRHASAEELLTGEHLGGLRINRKRYVRVMRKDVQETLGVQLYGPLFGQVDQQAQYLLRALVDMEETDALSHALPPLRQLLYDEFDQKFLATRYDAQSKKALRNFDDASDDGLFFALDSTAVRSLATEHFVQMYHYECQQQQLFLTGPPPQLMQLEEPQFY